MTLIPAKTSRCISTFAFLATILVVICHTDDIMLPESRSLLVRYLGGTFSDANVCNFFFLSGFLLARHCGESNWWRRSIIVRLRSLVIPYVAWCVVYGFASGYFLKCWGTIHYAFCADGRSVYDVVFEIARAVRHTLGIGFLLPPCNFPLWYVKTLLYFVLISAFAFSVLLKTRRRFVVTISILVMFFIVGHALHLAIMPYFGFCFHLLGFVAFLSGAYCAKNDIVMLPEKMLYASPIVPLAIWGVVSSFCFAMALIVKGSAIMLSPLNIAVSVICLVWISFTVKKGISSLLTKCTFFIYAAHMIVLKCVSKSSLVYVLPSFIFFSVVVIGTIFACVGMAHATNYILPSIANILSGGRFERSYNK